MRSVTICSSNRFAEEALAFADGLRKLGVTVFVPHFYTHHYGGLENVTDHNKQFLAMGLTLDHFQKIRKADAAFIYNKEGYIGISVTQEMGYAAALGKAIYALSDKEEEVCRAILVDGYAKTPAELAKLLS